MAPRKKVQIPGDEPVVEAVNEDMIDTILNQPEVPEEEVSEADLATPPVPEEDDELDEEEEVSIDDLPDEAELWPGGPVIGQVKAWKEEYGDGNVYVTSITYDKHVVWRTMNRAEYKNHIRNLEKLTQSGQLGNSDAGLYNEEAIAELCILYPQYDRRTSGNEMAGVPSIISQEVMEASGFVALEVRQL